MIAPVYRLRSAYRLWRLLVAADPCCSCPPGASALGSASGGSHTALAAPSATLQAGLATPDQVATAEWRQPLSSSAQHLANSQQRRGAPRQVCGRQMAASRISTRSTRLLVCRRKRGGDQPLLVSIPNLPRPSSQLSKEGECGGVSYAESAASPGVAPCSAAAVQPADTTATAPAEAPGADNGDVFEMDEGAASSPGPSRSPQPASMPGTGTPLGSVTPPPQHAAQNADIAVERRVVPLLEYSEDTCSICLDDYTREDPGAPTTCGWVWARGRAATAACLASGCLAIASAACRLVLSGYGVCTTHCALFFSNPPACRHHFHLQVRSGCQVASKGLPRGSASGGVCCGCRAPSRLSQLLIPATLSSASCNGRSAAASARSASGAWSWRYGRAGSGARICACGCAHRATACHHPSRAARQAGASPP